MTKIDFNKYKTEISLPDFLVNEYNFSPVKGSAKKHPKLKHPVTGDTFVIKKNSQNQYTYFDVHDDSVKGQSILDFLMTEYARDSQPISLTQAAEILDEYMDSGKSINPSNSNFILESSSLSLSKLTSIAKALKPVSDETKAFFYKRGITDEILNHPCFKDTIWEKPFLDDNKNLHTNVVFRMQSFSPDFAFSQRNEEFKGCLGPRGKCLASSARPSLSKPLDKIFFAESMIDAMSHLSLNFDSLKDKNIAYVSSEGNLVSDQLEQFNLLLKQYNYPESSLIFDNDLAGHYYAAMTLSQIQMPDSALTDVDSTNSIPVKFDLPSVLFEVEKGKELSKVEFTLPFSFDIFEFTSFFTSNLNKINQEAKDTLNQFFPLVKPGVTEVKYQFSFASNQQNWKTAADLIKNIKFGPTNSISRELSILSDFNDDLTLYKHQNKSYSLTPVENGIKISSLKSHSKNIIINENPYSMRPSVSQNNQPHKPLNPKSQKDFSIDF